MKLSLLSVAVFVPLLASTAHAQWSDNFDSYAANSQIVGQGGWEEWGPGAGALVSNARARSGANSVDIVGATDLVHQYSNYTSGTWVYTAWQYFDSSTNGSSYFILLNTYFYPSGPYNWSVQVAFSTAGVDADAGSSAGVTHPIVMDQWVEIKVIIYLDEDWVQFYYDGDLLDDPALTDHPALGGGYRWTGGVFGGGSGALEIAAVDLYANSADSVYYDDMSLEPAVYTSIGKGCPGSLGDISLTQLQPPATGSTHLVQIGNLAQSMGFNVMSLDRVNSPAGPLPLDLGPYGAPGCSVYLNPIATQLLIGSGSQTVSAWTIPNYAPLVGLKAYQQIAAIDPTANNLMVVVSDAMLVVVQ